jgi:hypothetical protein
VFSGSMSVRGEQEVSWTEGADGWRGCNSRGIS